MRNRRRQQRLESTVTIWPPSPPPSRSPSPASGDDRKRRNSKHYKSSSSKKKHRSSKHSSSKHSSKHKSKRSRKEESASEQSISDTESDTDSDEEERRAAKKRKSNSKRRRVDEYRDVGLKAEVVPEEAEDEDMWVEKDAAAAVAVNSSKGDGQTVNGKALVAAPARGRAGESDSDEEIGPQPFEAVDSKADPRSYVSTFLSHLLATHRNPQIRRRITTGRRFSHGRVCSGRRPYPTTW